MKDEELNKFVQSKGYEDMSDFADKEMTVLGEEINSQLLNIAEREARRNLLEKVNKIIDGLIGDDLAYKYKEYEKSLSNMCTMEACNNIIGCNAFVIDKLKKQIRKKLEKELKP